jgi:hypothetical protein
VIDDLNSNQSIDEGVRIKEEANKSADLCGIDWVMIGTAFETQTEVVTRIVVVSSLLLAVSIEDRVSSIEYRVSSIECNACERQGIGCLAKGRCPSLFIERISILS